MSSIIKVDTVQDQAGNNIINESSDTITIGASGDTVNIVGTITGFTSTGIDDNATSTAITINSSEQVEFTAGTALLPAITTTGDANTGMWFPAANTIAFSEGASEAMRIDSDGNIGIGTASPSQALDVVGSIEVSDGVYIGGTAAANKLDDYEEGTWTASFSDAGGGSYGYSLQTGNYTKIGNTVFISTIIITSGTFRTGGSGNVLLNGLPFAMTTGSFGGIQALNSYGSFANKPLGAETTFSGTSCNIFYRTTANGSRIIMQASDISTSAYVAVQFTGFYKTT